MHLSLSVMNKAAGVKWLVPKAWLAFRALLCVHGEAACRSFCQVFCLSQMHSSDVACCLSCTALWSAALTCCWRPILGSQMGTSMYPFF